MAEANELARRTSPGNWLAPELSARILSALVLSVVTLLATYLGGWPFALLWLAAGVAILHEWANVTAVEPRAALQVVLSLGLVLLAGAYLIAASLWYGLAALAAAAVAAIALAAGARDRAWAIAGLAYAAVIVIVPPILRDDPRLGLVGVLWMLAVVWTTDVAAYFVGRGLGGPKLWPRVSPKKTWSGFFGGLIAGAAAGIGVALLAARWGWRPPLGMALVVLVSVLASILGQLGDLGESALKRRFDVKDASHLIPGHGGVMDRLDGFWAVALFTGALLAGTVALHGER